MWLSPWKRLLCFVFYLLYVKYTEVPVTSIYLKFCYRLWGMVGLQGYIRWKHFLCYWSSLSGIHWSELDSIHKANDADLSRNVFFSVRLNKRLGKQSRYRWFETPWWSLWRHCDDLKHQDNKDRKFNGIHLQVKMQENNCLLYVFKTRRPRQNCRHFADDI